MRFLCYGSDEPLLQESDGQLSEETGRTDYGVENIEGLQIDAGEIRKRTPLFVYTLTLLSAIGGFLFGYDTGVVSGATIPIADRFQFDTVWRELFVSITVAAAAIFAIVGGICNDKLGRKPTTLIASSVFTAGAIILAAAQNKGMLLAGRFILGIGIGFASTTVPMYIAESAPPAQRGQLVSLNQAFIAGGMFVAAIFSGGFCSVDSGWRYMLGLAAVPAVIQFVGFLFMPESPRWLVDQGKEEQAVSILRRIRGTSNVEQEFEGIRSACAEEARAKLELGGQSVVRKALTNSYVRRALIIGCILQVFQQICGINTVMYYSASIIRMAGVSDQCQAIWLASATAFCNFIFTFVGIALVERLGRRKLFLVSLAGVTLSLVFLGVAFLVVQNGSPDVTYRVNFTDSCADAHRTCVSCIEDRACGFCFTKDASRHAVNGSCVTAAVGGLAAVNGRCYINQTLSISVSPSSISVPVISPFILAVDYCPSPYAWMSVLGMVLYLASFAPGMGPMPWLINAEIYPLWARSFGNSLSTFTNWAFNLLISMTFLTLSEAMTKQGAFFLYASFGVVGLVFFFLFLPETQGKSLEQMEMLFTGSWFVRSKMAINSRTPGMTA